ncbi:unnamed protein product [Linum trigynum]|uniref:Auxin response factor n=1 Tax=Linum trigynum TaxID=586398 RepID=A0AAV2FF46_9ROSI
MAHSKGDGTQMDWTSFFGPTSTYEFMTVRKEESDYELWRACAWDWTDIPKVGQYLYYIPQGHMEQAQLEAWMSQQLNEKLPEINIPSKILCRDTKVERLIERRTDELYVGITLHPEVDQTLRNPQPDDRPESPPPKPVQSYNKILSTSDASTHGGFSIPKKLAIECLPPLDMIQKSTPTQEFAAKDLQGHLWRFRHIYRGQPRRHMLSTGWSDFVNKKQLVAGDEIVFLRYNGELRVGVRRGHPRRQQQASIVISSQIIYLGVVCSTNRSIKPETVFYVHYKPRTTPFLVGINKYLKATSRAYHMGMRFKSAGDDGFTGTIVGIGDYSQYWPGSQWRSLKVRWDQSEGRIEKADSSVSPWEIEPLAADPSLQSSVLPQTLVRKKRSRLDIDVLASAASNSTRRPRSSIQSHQEESTLLLGSGFEGQNNNHNNGHNLEGFLPNSTPGFNSNKASSSTATPSSGIWNEQMGSQRADNHHPMGCRIFGIELASNITANTSSVTGKQQLLMMASTESTVKNQYNRTKVHMQGTAFGRTVDLTTLNGYEDLITKLEEMFGIRGDQLSTAEKWVLVFIDDEGDMMLVGDDPWPEFCKMVKKIVIHSSEEMKKMKGRFRLVMSPLEG